MAQDPTCESIKWLRIRAVSPSNGSILNPLRSFISDLLGFWQLHLESDVVPASEDFRGGRWAAGK